MGSHPLSQGTSLTQGSNLSLLHCGRILDHLSQLRDWFWLMGPDPTQQNLKPVCATARRVPTSICLHCGNTPQLACWTPQEEKTGAPHRLPVDPQMCPLCLFWMPLRMQDYLLLSITMATENWYNTNKHVQWLNWWKMEMHSKAPYIYSPLGPCLEWCGGSVLFTCYFSIYRDFQFKTKLKHNT